MSLQKKFSGIFEVTQFTTTNNLLQYEYPGRF